MRTTMARKVVLQRVSARSTVSWMYAKWLMFCLLLAPSALSLASPTTVYLSNDPLDVTATLMDRLLTTVQGTRDASVFVMLVMTCTKQGQWLHLSLGQWPPLALLLPQHRYLGPSQLKALSLSPTSRYLCSTGRCALSLSTRLTTG